MKTVSFQLAHNLGKLHTEILAAIPALRPVNGSAVMTVSGNGATLTLGLPDAFDEALLSPVLAAHDPAPTPLPDPPVFGGDANNVEGLAANVTQIRAYLALASPTAPQTVGALKLTIRAVLFLLNRALGGQP